MLAALSEIHRCKIVTVFGSCHTAPSLDHAEKERFRVLDGIYVSLNNEYLEFSTVKEFLLPRAPKERHGL